MQNQDKILGPLPNPFLFADGRAVTTAADWRARREEIIEQAVELEYGGMPPKPEFLTVEQIHFAGKGKLNSYRIHTGTRAHPFSFVLQIHRPALDGRLPVILTGDGCYTCCGDEVVAEAALRGFLVAKFNRTEFAPDIYNSDRGSGIYLVYPEGHFSAISAWAWGYHRCMDALEQMDFVDASQVAITGHSRGGKTALGAGCYRYEQYESEPDGRSEKLEDLVRAVPYWLGPRMKDYIGRETELPHDMHFFKALVAPRCLLQTEGRADTWGNPKGSYQTFMAAREVYRFLGAEKHIVAWYREGGHRHALPDFCALFDFMEAMRGTKPLDHAFTTNPYPDMTPIYHF